jgi:hypothetical protein
MGLGVLAALALLGFAAGLHDLDLRIVAGVAVAIVGSAAVFSRA